MNQDLRFLAENITEWPERASDKDSVRRDGMGWSYTNSEHCNGQYFRRTEWRAARDELAEERVKHVERVTRRAMAGVLSDPIQFTTEDDEAWRELEKRQSPTGIDVYRVHRLFGVVDHEIHHASKKLLLCGVRTEGKPARKEIEEARDTLTRWLEIQDEDEAMLAAAAGEAH